MLALYKQLIVQFYHLDDVQYVKAVKNRRINKKEAHGYMNSLEYENLLENKTHADPMFPYNTYLCSIPLDFNSVSLHWHEFMEIIYIKKGKGNVTVDFTTHYVEEGDIVIILPGHIHGISQHEGYSMEYENILFSVDMFRSRNHDSLDSEFFLPLLAGDVDIKSIYDRDDSLYPSLSACLNRVDKLCSETPKGYHLALKGCYFEFFYILYANSTARDEADRKNRARDLERTKLILSYIDENYKEAISITDIASYCGFSESHFMRFFKNTMGVSFVSYLNDFRLNVAARLLSSNDESILSVAENCGFFNLSYFNRMFKKKYGVTPGKYRDNHNL